MRLPAEEPEDYHVPITPLIDIVFLLLIFFATSTSFVDPEKYLNIHLPRGTEGVKQRERSTEIIVNVTKAGTIIIHGKVLDIDDVIKLLKDATADDPKQAVKVRGDRMTHHKHIVAVLNACITANVKNMSIAQFEENQ